MHMPTTQWDRGPTDKELDAFYGKDATQEEIDLAIGNCASGFDADDLSELMYGVFEQIADALADKDMAKVGNIIDLARRQSIAARASKAIYGRTMLITADEVHV
jgi:hypothetical protein